jgi:hypothetical protein
MLKLFPYQPLGKGWINTVQIYKNYIFISLYNKQTWL